MISLARGLDYFRCKKNTVDEDCSDYEYGGNHVLLTLINLQLRCCFELTMHSAKILSKIDVLNLSSSALVVD